MKYLVMEIQKFNTGAFSTPVYAYDSINSALAKYHSILASAATSSLPLHAAVVMDETGNSIAHEAFVHESEEE